MICPDCGGTTCVVDSRERSDGAVRRRRICAKCRVRFSTVETCVDSDHASVKHKAHFRHEAAQSKVRDMALGMLEVILMRDPGNAKAARLASVALPPPARGQRLSADTLRELRENYGPRAS